LRNFGILIFHDKNKKTSESSRNLLGSLEREKKGGICRENIFLVEPERSAVSSSFSGLELKPEICFLES